MSDDKQQDGPLSGALHKVQDMVGGAVGMASATAGSHSSEAFVQNATVGDLYEIEAGSLAMRRARSDAVRAFGQMMVEHHTTSAHQLQSALLSSEVTRQFPDLQPSGEMDARRAGLLKHLLDADDDAFDRMYVDQQKLAHQETATLLKGYAENGDNPQLRSVALGAVPMVERHLGVLRTLGVH